MFREYVLYWLHSLNLESSSHMGNGGIAGALLYFRFQHTL